MRRNRISRGQSAIEFLFIIMFFMMLVGFVRTFVYFELDVFNATNVARYQTLRYIRGGGFGAEQLRPPMDINQDFQIITTTRLRPMPFIRYPGGPTTPAYLLTPRRLLWTAGTQGGDCGAVMGCEPWFPYVLMTGFTANP